MDFFGDQEIGKFSPWARRNSMGKRELDLGL